MRKLILLFCLSLPAFCAWPHYGNQWDIQPTGNDANGGGFDPNVASPGTNKALGSVVTFSDLIVSGTSATSITLAFDSTSPGNFFHIVSGSGCTTGWFEIVSQVAGTITANSSMGTGTCTGRAYGPLLTICNAQSSNQCTGGTLGLVSNALDTIWVKSGTYNTSIQIPIASTNAGSIVNVSIVGYNSTHGDISTPCTVATTCPLIVQTSGSTYLFSLVAANSLSGSVLFQNLELSCSQNNCYPLIGANIGGPDLYAVNVKFDVLGVTNGTGIYNNAKCSYMLVWGCEFSVPSPNAGIADFGETAAAQDGYGLFVYYSYFHGTGNGVWDGNTANAQAWHLHNNAFNIAYPVYAQATADDGLKMLDLFNNSFYSPTAAAVSSNGLDPHWVFAANNIFYGGTYGMYIAGSYIATTGSVPFGVGLSRSNAYGSQSTATYIPYNYGTFSSGRLTGTPAGMGGSDIALGSCQPFNSPTTGDFSLSTCGKTALGAKGFPGVGPFGTGYADIGALQSKAASGSGVSPHAYVQ
jgi:hypothetical protein